MKIKCTISLLFVSLLMLSNIQAQAQYQLVWSDEFDVDGSVNSKFWNIEVNGDGGGNNELQYYTARSQNLRIENGELVIEAIKEAYSGKAYTSGRINSKGKKFWKYGKIEARMKLPYGQGVWPAFWTLGESLSTVGWPNCGEMDVMELIGGTGYNDRTAYMTFHWGPVVNGGHPWYQNKKSLASGKFADDYHVFALEWDEYKATGWCDGQQYFTMSLTAADKEAFHNNFFIILNFAVGGSWPGSPDANTVFPQKMLVDYVRVYKKTSDFKITGSAEVIENTKNLIYSVERSDSFKYEWILPASVTALTKLDSNLIKVNWGCNMDTMRIKVMSKTDTTIAKLIVQLKKQKITGKIWVSENAQGVSYIADSVAGAKFKWIPDDGLTIVGADTAKQIKVNFANEGRIRVRITTPCGNEYLDSLIIAFGDGQFPYPNANVPWPIPGSISAGNYNTGGEGVAYHDIDVANKGGASRTTEGVDTQSGDGGITTGYFDNSEWLQYTVNIKDSANYKFSVKIDGQIVITKVTVPVGTVGNWTTFNTVVVDPVLLNKGVHVMRITSNGGFNLGTMTFEKSNLTSLPELKDTRVLYPNPVHDKLFVNTTNASSEISIFSIDGKQVLNFKSLNTTNNGIDVNKLNKGVYLLKLSNGGKTVVEKFIKE
jgi:beta-glucanase (GH16 family)